MHAFGSLGGWVDKMWSTADTCDYCRFFWFSSEIEANKKKFIYKHIVKKILSLFASTHNLDSNMRNVNCDSDLVNRMKSRCWFRFRVYCSTSRIPFAIDLQL